MARLPVYSETTYTVVVKFPGGRYYRTIHTGSRQEAWAWVADNLSPGFELFDVHRCPIQLVPGRKKPPILWVKIGSEYD